MGNRVSIPFTCSDQEANLGFGERAGDGLRNSVPGPTIILYSREFRKRIWACPSFASLSTARMHEVTNLYASKRG